MLHGLKLSFALLATWLVAGIPALVQGYDAEGLRVSRQVGGGTPTRYLVDTLNPTGYAQVLAEYSGDGTSRQLVRAYTHGLDLLSQRTAAGGLVEFFSTDALGSTRFLTRLDPTPGAGGGINGSLGELTTQTFSYDAYGLLAYGSAAATAYLYTGEQWDVDVGAYYLRARWHLPEWGRFLSRDTYEGAPDDPVSQNRFLYCQANPVNMVDPSGHVSEFQELADRGNAAHEVIFYQYLAEHYADNVRSGARPIGVGVNPNLKPDIQNFSLLNYMEIKPLTLRGIKEGVTKMNQYANSLGRAAPPWQPGDWPSGIRFTPTAYGAVIYFNVEGLIFYADAGLRDLLPFVVVPTTIKQLRLAVRPILGISSKTLYPSLARAGALAANRPVADSSRLQTQVGVAALNRF